MSRWQRARQLADAVGSRLKKAGEKYSQFAERAARPMMRGYDAALMTPDQRAGLVFSQRDTNNRLNPTDQNLLGRLMISDPADTSANRLLNDESFAAALGTTTKKLNEQRKQTLEAIDLADRIQTEAAPNPSAMGGAIPTPALDESLRVSTLLRKAREDGSNENVTRLLEAISDPQVSRPSNPQNWDAGAFAGMPINDDFQSRMMTMETSYLNPYTNERVPRKPMPVPPGEQFSQTELLSQFLNRAYDPPESTTRLGQLEQRALENSGGFNRDFSGTTPDDAATIGAQGFRDLNQLQSAMQGIEDIGLDAAYRLGHTSTAEQLRKAEGLKNRSKIHDSEGRLQPIALDRLADRQSELGRTLTKQERTKVLNDLNDELPDVAYRLGLGALEQEEHRTLFPRRFAADILSAADRAGYKAVNVPDIATTGMRQPKYAYLTDDARDLNRLITDPKTGAVIGGTALLGTVAAIQAAINNQRENDLEFNRDITGHPAFSKTIPQEVNYVLRTIDPNVLAQIVND